MNDSKTKAKCPKCRSKNLYLTEIWEGHGIQWEQNDGQINRDAGSLEPGDPFKVEGKCQECGHGWTFKGVIQIDNLIVES